MALLYGRSSPATTFVSSESPWNPPWLLMNFKDLHLMPTRGSLYITLSAQRLQPCNKMWLAGHTQITCITYTWAMQFHHMQKRVNISLSTCLVKIVMFYITSFGGHTSQIVGGYGKNLAFLEPTNLIRKLRPLWSWSLHGEIDLLNRVHRPQNSESQFVQPIHSKLIQSLDSATQNAKEIWFAGSAQPIVLTSKPKTISICCDTGSRHRKQKKNP